MASLRDIAACIGVGGDFSVVRDFMGYVTGVYGHPDLALDFNDATLDQVVTDPTRPGTISLKRQTELLRGRHVHLDVILVGPAAFSGTERQEIDVAIHMARAIWARHGLGIGRIHRSFIPDEDVGVFASIDTECEVSDLIDEWEAHGGGIDVFFVHDLDMGLAGATPTKDAGGLLVEIQGNASSGLALAHELGHYFGLEHVETKTNLMVKAALEPPYDLDGDQKGVVFDHDSILGGCP